MHPPVPALPRAHERVFFHRPPAVRLVASRDMRRLRDITVTEYAWYRYAGERDFRSAIRRRPPPTMMVTMVT